MLSVSLLAPTPAGQQLARESHMQLLQMLQTPPSWWQIQMTQRMHGRLPGRSVEINSVLAAVQASYSAHTSSANQTSIQLVAHSQKCVSHGQYHGQGGVESCLPHCTLTFCDCRALTGISGGCCWLQLVYWEPLQGICADTMHTMFGVTKRLLTVCRGDHMTAVIARLEIALQR